MKSLIAVIWAGLLLSVTPVAAAVPPDISGTLNIKYQSDTVDLSPTDSGTMYTFTLKGEQKLNSNLSLFARLGSQYASNPVLADFNQNSYGQNVKAVYAIDQFGLIYRNRTLSYTVGRQEAIIGPTALLYKRSNDNIGNDVFVDGLTVNGSIGNVDLFAIAARENNIWLNNNSLFAVHGGYNLTKNFSLGLTLAQYNYFDSDSTNHWGADILATRGKSSFIGGYTQSNRSSANKAYVLNLNHDFDGKTSVYISNFCVEANGDMGGQGEYDNNNHGFYYGLIHNLSKTLQMEFTYKDQFSLADGSRNAKLELWLRNKF